MKRVLIALAALLAVAAIIGLHFVLPRLVAAHSDPGRPFSYAPYAYALSQAVDAAGQVDYARLQQQRDSLEAFLGLLAMYSPEATPDIFPDRHSRLAYWINAYNAFVLEGVLEAYPVASVHDVLPLRGFFWRLHFIAGGKELDLHDLENNKLRRNFADPRIHFAINCASWSCPPLHNRPYLPDSLDTQLDRAVRRFVQKPSAMAIDTAAGVVRLSKIFEWYRDDFVAALPSSTSGALSLLAYLRRYASPTQKALLARRDDWRFEFIPYDWRLNARPTTGSQER